jgi:hypothetical protein
MAAVEVWRGLSYEFENGKEHKIGGPLMRCVVDTQSDVVTFEISNQADAMGLRVWIRSAPSSQFILNAACRLLPLQPVPPAVSPQKKP